MIKVDFKIIQYGSDDYKESIELRKDVLRKPLGLEFNPHDLELEKPYIHVAGFIDNKISATAILILEGEVVRMKQVAVRADLHGKGVGRQLLQFCEQYAIDNGCREIYAHVRMAVQQFYSNNQYIPEGELFYEVTLPHIRMRKTLTTNGENYK